MPRYNEIMSGDVEIMGDPAMIVTEADKSITEYTAKGFKLSDKIWVGIGNGVSIAANAAGPTLGPTLTVSQQVNNPFKPYLIHFPSEYNVDTYLEQLSYGSLNMIDGDPVPNTAFSEASEIGVVSIPTVQTAQPVSIRCRNDSTDQIQVAYALRGIRLRQ